LPSIKSCQPIGASSKGIKKAAAVTPRLYTWLFTLLLRWEVMEPMDDMEGGTHALALINEIIETEPAI
jgi:hypothetical protein